MSNKLCQKSAYVNTLPSNTVHVGKVHKERHCAGEQCAELGSLNRPCLHLKQACEVVNQKKLTNVIVQIAAGDYTDTDKDFEIPSAIRKIEGAGKEVTKLGSGLKVRSGLSISNLSIGTDPNKKAIEFKPIMTVANTARSAAFDPFDFMAAITNVNIFGWTDWSIPDDVYPLTINYDKISQELGAAVSNLLNGQIAIKIEHSNFVKNGNVSANPAPFTTLQNAENAIIEAWDNNYNFQYLAGSPATDPYVWDGDAPAKIASSFVQYNSTRFANFVNIKKSEILSKYETVSDDTQPVSGVADPFMRLESNVLSDVASVKANINNFTSNIVLSVADPSSTSGTTISAQNISIAPLPEAPALPEAPTNPPVLKLKGGPSIGVLENLQTPKQHVLDIDSAPSGEMSTITLKDAIAQGIGKVKNANLTVSGMEAKPNQNPIMNVKATAPPEHQISDKIENCIVRITGSLFENSKRVFKDCRSIAESNVNFKNTTTSSCLETDTSPTASSYKLALARIEESQFILHDGLNFELASSNIINRVSTNTPLTIESSPQPISGLIKVVGTTIDHKGSTFLKFLT